MATDVIRVIQYPVNVVRVITAGPQGVAGTGLDTLTTKGDTLGHNGTSAVRLPVGTNGQVLTADSTATPGVKWATITATSAWADITGKPSTFPPESHNHAASEITSGTFANARINWAAPSAIGAGTAAAGTFTALIATTELQLPLNAPGTPSAGDLYRVSDTLRYRDGSNVERLLLNATDNLANLANAATARTNLGLGTGDSPTFLNLALARGTITTSSPFTLTQTWNAGAVTFTGFDINITNTASAGASRVFETRAGGTSVFSVDIAGTIRTGAFGNILLGANAQINSGAGGVAANGQSALWSGHVVVDPSGRLHWRSNTWNLGGYDLALERDAANILAQRNGTNAQTFRLYGTRTDASNGRWLSISSTTAGVFAIAPTGNGTGASGNVLHISGLPTSNPGPGILWNNGGSVAIGT